MRSSVCFSQSSAEFSRHTRCCVCSGMLMRAALGPMNSPAIARFLPRKAAVAQAFDRSFNRLLRHLAERKKPFAATSPMVMVIFLALNPSCQLFVWCYLEPHGWRISLGRGSESPCVLTLWTFIRWSPINLEIEYLASSAAYSFFNTLLRL